MHASPCDATFGTETRGLASERVVKGGGMRAMWTFVRSVAHLELDGLEPLIDVPVVRTMPSGRRRRRRDLIHVAFGHAEERQSSRHLGEATGRDGPPCSRGGPQSPIPVRRSLRTAVPRSVRVWQVTVCLRVPSIPRYCRQPRFPRRVPSLKGPRRRVRKSAIVLRRRPN